MTSTLPAALFAFFLLAIARAAPPFTLSPSHSESPSLAPDSPSPSLSPFQTLPLLTESLSPYPSPSDQDDPSPSTSPWPNTGNSRLPPTSRTPSPSTTLSPPSNRPDGTLPPLPDGTLPPFPPSYTDVPSPSFSDAPTPSLSDAPAPSLSPDDAPSLSPTVSSAPNRPRSIDIPACFPGSATVLLQSGKFKSMRDVQIGDMVAVGAGRFSPVYFFSHRVANGNFEFVRVKTEGGREVVLSAGHLIPIDGGRLVPAGEVEVGEWVEEVGGGVVKVVGVERGVRGEGLYNPHTMEETVTVDGIVVSVFTTWVDAKIARALLAPVKFAYKMGLGRVLEGIWDDGKPGVARWVAVAARKMGSI